uniref:ProSAAS n=1 Tax=Macrostomum lignano TaxID=282301 RepID=A0A1I8GA41_9PLAT
MTVNSLPGALLLGLLMLLPGGGDTAAAFGEDDRSLQLTSLGLSGGADGADFNFGGGIGGPPGAGGDPNQLLDPNKFQSPEALKEYLERLQLYYALVRQEAEALGVSS